MYVNKVIEDDEDLGWIQFIAPVVEAGVGLIKKRQAKKKAKKAEKKAAQEEAAYAASQTAAPAQAGFGGMPSWVLPVGIGLLVVLLVPKLLGGRR